MKITPQDIPFLSKKLRALSDEALVWLAMLGRGLSAWAMYTTVIGIRDPRGYAIHSAASPQDMDDVSRCVKLCDLVPEILARRDRIASISLDWAALMGGWDELVALARAERDGWPMCEGYAGPKSDAMFIRLLGRT